MSSNRKSRANNISRHRSVLLMVPAVCCLFGCGPGNPLNRVPVSGQVSLDGNPIDAGTIEFSPMTAGTGSGAKIVAGVYSIEEVRGLPPGKYLVRIFAPQLPANVKPRAPGEPPGPESSLLGIERVASRFNSQTTLSVEIPATSEPQSHDFAVTSK